MGILVDSWVSWAGVVGAAVRLLVCGVYLMRYFWFWHGRSSISNYQIPNAYIKYYQKSLLISKYLQDPKDTPLPTKYETKDEKLERRRKEKQEQVAYKLEQEIAHCKLN